MNPFRFRFIIGFVSTLGVWIQSNGPAQAQEQAPKAVTAQDPSIPLDELKLLLKPLTKDEIAVEADAWLGLVKAKVAEISRMEIEASRPAGPKGNIASPEGEPSATPTGETGKAANVELLEKLPDLRDDRVALTDRLRAVIDELELKGGDGESYEKYLSAISAIKIDVADATGAWVIIKGWLRSPQGGIRWGLNVLKFLGTLLVFWILALIVERAVRRTVGFSKGPSELFRTFAVNLSRRIVLVAGLLMALTMLEIKLGPVLAIIGAAAFVVAFALQGTLSNFASGLLILAYRPFDLGDFINAGGVAGTVESMTLISTQLKSPDNQKIVVPNNSIWGGVITNVTGKPIRRIDLVFGIGYGDDIEKALQLLDDEVKKHPLVLKDPEPVIKVHELADSSVNFVCRPWAKTSDYWNVYWDLTRAVKERFDRDGISFPFPQRDVHMHQTAALS